MSAPPSVRHPISNVFLLHIAAELPFIIYTIFDPRSLPFLGMNNTTLIITKLFAMLSLGTCATAFLTHSLPEWLPGKRAFVIGITIYHGAVAHLLTQSERFIPVTFGPKFEAFSITPEFTWGAVHGLLAVFFIAWWQLTLPYAQVAGAAARQQ
ncbi:hypothetical protein DL96DRAFT_1597676 [Flagelloscypha sp. PMI_526]|nr:hypothetical protein DL96DRAFT_1597676 [Flagelloscypha sp. PMI_526]